jgi:hypothetical protein
LRVSESEVSSAASSRTADDAGTAGTAGTVGIGVIGAGKVAAAYHLPAIAAVQGARLVAVAAAVVEHADAVSSRLGHVASWRR